MSDDKGPEPNIGGEFADALFEAWWKVQTDFAAQAKPAAREAWDACVALTISRCVAKLWGEARTVLKEGKTVSAQAIRFAATKLAEMP